MRKATDEDALEALRLMEDEGDSIYQTHFKIGCDYSSLKAILRTDPYSARAISARIDGADAHEHKSFEVVEAIQPNDTKATVQRQLALSQRHARAAASRDPRRHGDKVAIGGAEDLPAVKVEHDVTDRAINLIDRIRGKTE